MKLKRPGHQPVSFGACPTSKLIKRYVLTEGFVIGKGGCCACGYEWDLIIRPEKLPVKLKPGIHALTMPDQPCVKCGKHRVTLTVRFE